MRRRGAYSRTTSMEGRVVRGASSNLHTQPNIWPPSSMATSLCLIMPTFMAATCATTP